jgi:hypothetical protein
MSILFTFGLLVAAVSVCGTLLSEGDYSSLIAMARVNHYIESSPRIASDLDGWRLVELLERPNCPNNASNPLFQCNADGDLTRLSFTGNGRRWTATASDAVLSPFNLFRTGMPALTNVTLANYEGAGDIYSLVVSRRQRTLHMVIANCTFWDQPIVGRDMWLNLLSVAASVTMTNVTNPRFRFTPRFLTAPVPDLCTFVNVTFQCDVPEQLWVCYGNASVAPECKPPQWDLPDDHIKLVDPCPISDLDSNYICYANACPDRAPVGNATQPLPCGKPDDLKPSYRPALLGLNTIDLSWAGLAYARYLQIEQDPVTIVTHIDVFDFDTGQWVVVFDDPVPPRDAYIGSVHDAATVVQYMLPPVRTNRVRFTAEFVLPTDKIAYVKLERVLNVTSAVIPLPTPKPVVECAKPLTLGGRALLDETIGDSFCVGRVCQDVCLTNGVLPATLANLTVGVAVVPKYVVVFGGTGTASTMSTEPSFGTRVFAVESSSASPSTRVELSGGGNVRNAKRVRVVSERTASDMTTSSEVTIAAAQVIRQLAGTWVKRLRGNVTATTYSGALAVQRTQDAWPTTFAGSTSAPFDAQNASVVAFNATSSMALVYGAANDGVLDRWWRFDATNDLMWRSIVAPLRPAYVNQSSAAAAAVAERRRVLVAVAASGASGGLVVAVGAVVNERYDGRRNSSLAARRAVQTPVDLFDVERNVWIAGVLLEHNIERPVSELQVVTTKTTATTTTIAVTTNGTMSFEFEWRPFTVALRECTEQTECSSCLQSNLTLDLCQWCGAQCLPRSAPCGSRTERCEEVTTTSSLVSTTSTATTTMTTIVNTTNANASTTASSSAAIGPVTSSSESGLSSGTVIAIAVPVAIVGTLLLAAAVAGAVIFSRRGGKGDKGVTEMTTPTPTLAASTTPTVGTLYTLPAETEDDRDSVSLSE